MMSKKESGFTLIEIVMVLVLLGILMAVAAPKYFDLQKEARIQAENAIVAEIQSRVNGEFATQLLAGETCTKASSAAINSVITGSDGATAGTNVVKSSGEDWKAEVSTAGVVTITWGKDNTSTGKTHSVTIPQCR